MKTRVLLVLLVLLVLPVFASAQLALIRQGRESAGAAEAGDYFGSAVACGDFNGDGFDDVAIGAPFEKIGASLNPAGVVTVNYGSQYGVTWVGARLLQPSDGGYDNTKPSQMGTALAVGNFNNDAYEDLAVGLPAAEISGQASAGLVLVYLGGANGLSANAFPLTQIAFGGLVEAGDRFGAALATGRLGTDAYDDLAIGSPGENSSAGAAFVIFGYVSGVNTNQTLAIDSAAIGLVPQPAAGLGAAVAIGNVRRGAQAELIIGAPDADIGAVLNAGLVHIIRGNVAGLNLADRLSIDMTVTGQPLEANARFGFSFAVGNFDGGLDGVQDVAIGIPGMFGGAGRVLVVTGSATGDPTFPTLLYQTNAAEPGGPEAGDNFGWGLAAGDFTGDGIDDLAVGAPGEDVLDPNDAPVSNSGWVNIHDGSATGLSSQREESHGEAYFSDAPNGPASLGVAVAFGKTSANQRQSLLAAAPVRNGNTGQVYDFAPWRQVPALECRTAMCADCAGNIIYALKPFEHVKIASTTKIMTVLLGCEATARPANDPLHVALDEQVLIPSWLANEFGPDSGCSIFLYAPFGDTHSFYALMRECVMVSGNDSAHAIANTITDEANAWVSHTGTEPMFVAMMNARAAQLGMSDTFFTNPPGVDDSDPYSSAYDMLLLAHTAMQNPLFRGIVGGTQFAVDHFVAGAEAGVFVPSSSKIAYSWLVSLKKRDKRIIGIKPGGTPGAGTTGVVALQPGDDPIDLAFADGFGWADGGTAKDQLAALSQLAARYCADPIPPGTAIGELTGPIGQTEWQAGGAVREGLQMQEFPSGGGPPMTGDEIGIVLFPLAPIPAGADPVVPVQWSDRALWSVSPGTTTGVQVRPVVGTSGALRNVGGSTVSLTITLTPPGTVLNVNLAPFQRIALPAWTSAVAANVHWTIRNNTSTATALLSLDGRFDFAPNLSGTPAPVFRASLTPDTKPQRHGWHFGERNIGTTPTFPVLVAAEDRANGFRYLPPIRIESFNVNRTPLNDGVVILYSSLPAGSTAFYQSYDIEMSLTLSPPAWTRVATAPANYSGSHALYQDIFVPAPSRFFRVVGNAQP